MAMRESVTEVADSEEEALSSSPEALLGDTMDQRLEEPQRSSSTRADGSLNGSGNVNANDVHKHDQSVRDNEQNVVPSDANSLETVTNTESISRQQTAQKLDPTNSYDSSLQCSYDLTNAGSTVPIQQNAEAVLGDKQQRPAEPAVAKHEKDPINPTKESACDPKEKNSRSSPDLMLFSDPPNYQHQHASDADKMHLTETEQQLLSSEGNVIEPKQLVIKPTVSVAKTDSSITELDISAMEEARPAPLHHDEGHEVASVDQENNSEETADVPDAIEELKMSARPVFDTCDHHTVANPPNFAQDSSVTREAHLPAEPATTDSSLPTTKTEQLDTSGTTQILDLPGSVNKRSVGSGHFQEAKIHLAKETTNQHDQMDERDLEIPQSILPINSIQGDSGFKQQHEASSSAESVTECALVDANATSLPSAQSTIEPIIAPTLQTDVSESVQDTGVGKSPGGDVQQVRNAIMTDQVEPESQDALEITPGDQKVKKSLGVKEDLAISTSNEPASTESSNKTPSETADNRSTIPSIPLSPLAASSTPSEPHPPSPQTAQEVLLADLKAQRATLLSSLAALPTIKSLIASANPPSTAEPTEPDILAAAHTLNKKHIKLLHEYNEMKDVGQGLMGLIADQRGVRIVEVQDEFGIEAQD